ncbi:MAG: diacylglycerol kinase family lipid kinase [Clostridia bacterium]|nr:diacylglycerol kinase family lipid kinase [Clostridia bacterium]
MKAMIIINPRAGKMRARTALFDVAETFCRAGYTPVVQITAERGDGTRFAIKAAKEKFDLVVCCGGDGTLNEVITGIVSSGSDIPLGYIPTGSTNDFARTLGLNSVPKKAAQAIVSGAPSYIDAGKFGDSRYFSYIASFGMFTAASYNTQQTTKNVMGHMAYVLEGIRDIGLVKPYHLKVSTPEKIYEGDYIFGSVTNSTSVGGIVKLEKSLVDLNDGLFEVALIKNPKDVAEFSRILIGLSNSDMSDPMFEFFKASELTFEAEEEFSWALDGEEASPGKVVEVKNINNAIKIVR